MGSYTCPQQQTPESVFVDYFARISKVLNQLDLDYFISFGTLLGYLRDGKHIKWDSDLDFGMSSKSFDRLEQNVHLIEQQGFKIMDTKNKGREKWRGMFIYDPNIKNFHIDISEWKYDWETKMHTFRWYLRLNLPSKIFDISYKIIEKQMKRMNDEQHVQTSDFSRYKRNIILEFLCKICFEIDFFFCTKRELQCYIPCIKKVIYYGITTYIPLCADEFTETNYGPTWMIPDSKFRGKGGSQCIQYKKDGWERCYVKEI